MRATAPPPRNPLLDALVDQYRGERQRHLDSITHLTEHRFRLWTHGPDGNKDVSDAWIETLRSYIAELDGLIAKHDATYGG